MKKLLIPLTFFTLIFMCRDNCLMSTPGLEADSLFVKNPNYRLQTGLYDVYKTDHAEIVMLGNSITHGVNWFELLGRNDVIERGIPSDILDGFLARMDYVYRLSPKICFVMGGINDIYAGIPVNFVFSSYKRILDGLREKGIIPVIQSTLYVSVKWHNAKDKNPEVEKLNKMLTDYAVKNNVDFIDLNALLSENKLLKDEYTYDGLHLKGEAYRIWRSQVEKILEKHGL